MYVFCKCEEEKSVCFVSMRGKKYVYVSVFPLSSYLSLYHYFLSPLQSVS